MVTVDTMKLDGREITIEFHAKLAKFYAKFDDVEYEAKTIDELKTQLTKAAKRAKAFEPVPATLLAARWGKPSKKSGWRADTDDLHSGTEEIGNAVDILLRGKNPRTRAALITVEGKKMSLDGYRHGDSAITRRLTPAEHKEYKALAATMKAAEHDLEAFIAGVKLDVDALTKGQED